MRKITQNIVSIFLAGGKKTIGNTSTDGNNLYLHGNLIARKVDDELQVNNQGWFTNTTKERLNGLPGVDIRQKDFRWYLNGKPMNGNTWYKVKGIKVTPAKPEKKQDLNKLISKYARLADKAYKNGDYEKADDYNLIIQLLERRLELNHEYKN